MQKAILLFATVAALAFAVGLSSEWRAAREDAAAPTPPAVEVTAEPADTGSSAPPVAAAAPAPRDPGADLPVVAVAEPPVHAVPADAGTESAPAVTFAAPAPAPARTAPAPAVREAAPVARTAALSPPPPRAPAPPRTIPAAARASVPAAAPIGGAARAAGGANLAVDGRAVHLFGVRAPDARDRCGEEHAACGEAARAALARRLAGNSAVTCVLPPGQEGEPAYVCHDSMGVDLGRLLVAEGLALADTSQSYQYLATQDDARVAHNGLWRYR